jgi:hypothetical protein
MGVLLMLSRSEKDVFSEFAQAICREVQLYLLEHKDEYEAWLEMDEQDDDQ